MYPSIWTLLRPLLPREQYQTFVTARSAMLLIVLALLLPSQTTLSHAAAVSSSASSNDIQATSDIGENGDLGWIHTASVPTQTLPLPSTQADAAPRTATGPIGSHSSAAVSFNGQYSADQLEKFWDDWVGAPALRPASTNRCLSQVGPVQQPPFTNVPEPANTYPMPATPPPLYPDYYTTSPKDILPGYKFPSDFKFGWATAAQQYEGAVKADGKGPSIWDWASVSRDS